MLSADKEQPEDKIPGENIQRQIKIADYTWKILEDLVEIYLENIGKGGKYVTFQLSSALFGGSADKYLPKSSTNEMRVVLSCKNQDGAFVLIR